MAESQPSVLVTGGAGYIGAHCCKELHRRGSTPVTVDSLIYGHRRNVRWGPFYEGGIDDTALLEMVLAKHSIQAVMHFAAFAYVGESMTDPKRYYENNVCGTVALLDRIVAHRIPHVIFSSSCATYGVPERLPIDESHPQRPISPYGKSKRMIEEILDDYQRAYPLRCMSLRYFNAAGADPEGELGEDHDPETHLIPLVLDAAQGGSKPLQVFGTDYDTDDGSCIRDYIHVTDLADAHILALEKLRQGSRGDCINLGIGNGYSVLEVIRTAETVTGRPIPFEVVQRRPGDPAVLVASNRKARDVLGWTPRFPQLTDIIATAWNWHRKR